MNRDRYNCEDIWELIEVGAQLVDVRSPQKYAAGALPGARDKTFTAKPQEITK